MRYLKYLTIGSVSTNLIAPAHAEDESRYAIAALYAKTI
jgi:hypothetical protein